MNISNGKNRCCDAAAERNGSWKLGNCKCSLQYESKTTTTTTMSRWFRSEPMEYISLIVNEDAAHNCLADLGTLGVIQFTDVSGFFSGPGHCPYTYM
jgi:hypothetical protein